MTPRSKSTKVVRVLEHSRVALPAGFDTAQIRERLEVTAARTGRSAFDIRGRHLYAKDVVGVVDIGSLVVEILPKTHESSSPDQAQSFLIELLQFTSADTHMSVSAADIDAGQGGLLEVLLAWIVRSVLHLVQHSVPRRYVVREEKSTSVRGRINLHHLAVARPGKAFELSVRHAPLSPDHPMMGIVRWLMNEVFAFARSAVTRSRCKAVLEYLSEVQTIEPGPEDFRALRLQPLEEDWSPVLRFAEVLAQQLSPNPTRAGSIPSIAVLFTLHDLFESTLREIFRGVLPDFGLRVGPRRSTYLLRPEAASANHILNLNPDFLFHGKFTEFAIGDAKWKEILRSDGTVQLTQADAYQMVTYLLALDSQVGFLFCPNFSSASAALRLSSWRVETGGQSLHIVGISVPQLIARTASGGSARAELCRLVSEKMRGSSTHLTRPIALNQA